MGSRSTRCRWSSPTSSSLPRHSIPRSRRAGQRATNDGYVNKCPALCRELLHISVTDRPTAARAAQQIVHAFPDETGPSYLLRNRDAIYGADFQRRVERMGIRQVVIAPRAPWQNPFAERVIGSIRRECLDLVIVLNERPLRHLLRTYFVYYNVARPHQSLGNDSPRRPAVQSGSSGPIVTVP